eukprot:scaffold26970_cov104-Isochrysis_galbana.AAC.6
MFVGRGAGAGRCQWTSAHAPPSPEAAHPSALPVRVHQQPLVPAEHSARLDTHQRSPRLVGQVAPDKVTELPLANKADARRVFLEGRVQVRFAGDSANLRLREGGRGGGGKDGQEPFWARARWRGEGPGRGVMRAFGNSDAQVPNAAPRAEGPATRV